MPPFAVNRDYVSPGLAVVVPDAHFPRMRAGDLASHPWKYSRRDVPHLWYADERFPAMGFMNRDEAAILHNMALQFARRPALEIGSWLGWSTCHLALAGVVLDVLDPAHADPELRAIAERSIAGCGVSGRVTLHPAASPDGVDRLAAERGTRWNLFVIDGDHEAPAPERDVRACLAHAADDCAFVLHDLASPAVALALGVLERAGFHVLVYQTTQIIGMAWRGAVTPVAHIPDPSVAWQLPHHLVGLPVSGVNFNEQHAVESIPARARALQPDKREPVRGFKTIGDIERGDADIARPSVCIVSSEIIGPFKNGGIGTAMTGLAEHLAGIGCDVTILYTRSVFDHSEPIDAWKARYATLGIRVTTIAVTDLSAISGPLSNCGFSAPYLVYRFLAAHRFDVVHFNDCGGDGSLCLCAKKLGLAFHDTLLVVAMHSPSQWVLELNHTLPAHLSLSAYRFAERLSVKCADVLWGPSGYILEWARQHEFELPARTFVQQYVMPSQRLKEEGSPSAAPAAEIRRGRTETLTEIVFFGRLEERKGLRLFCDAIDRLAAELSARNVTVTFLGKEQTCAGMSSLTYIAMRSAHWRFTVRTVTNLGQPEALSYLMSGPKLAVMASAVDNSPCTVYEALTWGFPFLAARTGGIPELIADADRDHVLFDPTTDGLSGALGRALDAGGYVARPSQPQADTRRAWSAFHSHWKQYAPPVHDCEAPERGVVAIVDGGSAADLTATLESLTAVRAIRQVIVLNRNGVPLRDFGGTFPVHNITFVVEGARLLQTEIALLSGESVLMIHGGILVRPDAFVRMQRAFDRASVDGLQPAAEITTRPPRIVAPLGGDPAFTLFEGATYTGGLLVRGTSLARAIAGRDLSPETAFMGLADFSVTRGLDVCPYPEPVFERSDRWKMPAITALPSRLAAFGECSSTDHYYMLAAGSSTRPSDGSWTRRAAVRLAGLGLLRLVRTAVRVRQWWRR